MSTHERKNGESIPSQIIQRELNLHIPDNRSNQDLVRQYLHNDFVEFGSSGRIWDKESIILAMASETNPVEIYAKDFVENWISPECILLTYRVEQENRNSLRSSIWVKENNSDWVMRFHQGTLIQG